MTIDTLRRAVVLVTGASRGIGRATAVEFAARGARVAVHYRQDEAAALETVALLGGDGHLAVAADLADPAGAAAVVRDVIDEYGQVDILVNNAAVYVGHPVTESSYDEWQRSWTETIATNLLGPANLTHQVVPHMIRAGGGRIVNVTSRGAFRGEPDHPAYGASKAGLNSFGQSMAQALARHRIFVTTVAPGFVETDMAAPLLAGPQGESIRTQSPLHRAADPAEVARMVVFLATPGTEYATGAVVDMNGASYLRT